MLDPELIDLLLCTACGGTELEIGSGRRPALVCAGCERRFPIVEGIPDMTAPNSAPEPGNYRTETLANLIAGVYDLVAPVMSLGVWRCSPLRYIDVTNRAVGRANGGVLVSAPVGTGAPLARTLASYHDVTVIGIDHSWKMLRKAARRFDKIDHPVHLVRADFKHLPLKDGAARAVHTLNGLHSFDNRRDTLDEFARVLDAGGYLSGSALVRGQEGVADTLLDRYERYGVYPLLRTPEFLARELREAPFESVDFATYGAVMFFSGLADRGERREQVATGL